MLVIISSFQRITEQNYIFYTPVIQLTNNLERVCLRGVRVLDLGVGGFVLVIIKRI